MCINEHTHTHIYIPKKVFKLPSSKKSEEKEHTAQYKKREKKN